MSKAIRSVPVRQAKQQQRDADSKLRTIARNSARVLKERRLNPATGEIYITNLGVPDYRTEEGARYHQAAVAGAMSLQATVRRAAARRAKQ